MAYDWSQLIPVGVGAAIAGGAAVLTAYLNHLLSRARERAAKADERSRHAAYLAIRVAIAFDKLVDDCAEAVGDVGIEDGSGYTHAAVGDPNLELPTDIDWRSIDPGLMYQLLATPNELQLAIGQVSFTRSEIASPLDSGEFFEERRIAYGRIGLRAAELATRLRQDFSLPPRGGSDEWRPEEVMQVAVVRAETARAKRWAATEAFAVSPPPPVSDKGV